MAKQEAKSVTYINFMLRELAKGNCQRIEVLGKFAKKFQRTIRSGDSYWKKAQEIHQNNIKDAKELIGDAYVESESEAIRLGLNNKNKIAQELWANVQRLREIRAGAKITVQDVAISEGIPIHFNKEMTVTYREEVSAIGEQTKAFAQIAQLYGLTSDSDKGGKVTVIVNSDEVKLISDEI